MRPCNTPVPIDRLNSLSAVDAERTLAACCGSAAWARRMAGARPFPGDTALFDTADRVWWSLSPADWLEAFRAHPRIGGQTTSTWSAEEQSGAAGADEAVHEALAAGNREYERRFGHVYIVCATGKTAGEMLSILQRRLRNAPDEELRIAAEEQRQITRLRLEKLIGGRWP